MKKVIYLTAAVMAFSFVTPQVSNAMKSQNNIAVVDDKDDKYKEIKAEELPEAVTKSISNAYTGYKIDKAYKGEDDSYKVKVAMGDLKYALFYDEKGELIKVEEPTAEKVDNAMDRTGDKVDRAIDKTEQKTSETWEKTEKKTSDAWDKSSIDTTKAGKSKTSNVEPSNKSNSTFPSNTQTR